MTCTRLCYSCWCAYRLLRKDNYCTVAYMTLFYTICPLLKGTFSLDEDWYAGSEVRSMLNICKSYYIQNEKKALMHMRILIKTFSVLPSIRWYPLTLHMGNIIQHQTARTHSLVIDCVARKRYKGPFSRGVSHMSSFFFIFFFFFFFFFFEA